jgi:quercetin dioxygenase-like cupin family protein
MRILLLAFALVGNDICAGEATKEILLDNDKVQLVRASYPVGTESGMHSHTFANRVVYVLQGGTVEIVPESGQSRTLQLQTGASLYLPAQTHNVKNIGNTEVILLETELKW